MKRKNIIRLAVSYLTLVSAVAIAASGPKPLSDAMPSGEDFLKTIKHYPYLATPERTQQITSGLSRVSLCMTKNDIKAILGSPDYSQMDFAGKSLDAPWLGSHWMYYIYMKHDGNDPQDPRVEIFFDTKDRATWIVPTSIDKAREMGAVNYECT